jgi:hypothetical protein
MGRQRTDEIAARVGQFDHEGAMGGEIYAGFETAKHANDTKMSRAELP